MLLQIAHARNYVVTLRVFVFLHQLQHHIQFLHKMFIMYLLLITAIPHLNVINFSCCYYVLHLNQAVF